MSTTKIVKKYDEGDLVIEPYQGRHTGHRVTVEIPAAWQDPEDAEVDPEYLPVQKAGTIRRRLGDWKHSKPAYHGIAEKHREELETELVPLAMEFSDEQIKSLFDVSARHKISAVAIVRAIAFDISQFRKRVATYRVPDFLRNGFHPPAGDVAYHIHLRLTNEEHDALFFAGANSGVGMCNYALASILDAAKKGRRFVGYPATAGAVYQYCPISITYELRDLIEEAAGGMRVEVWAQAAVFDTLNAHLD